MRSNMAQEFQESFFMSKKESELRSAFLEQVELIPGGHKIKQCIQCGTCTGSCPVSYAMDITPRRTIAMFRAGEIESILRSNTIWICASCYACTVRCPAGIKITDMMYAFKRIAMERNIYPRDLPVHALSSSFVSIVNKYGRNQEVNLLLRFGLKTNPAKLIAQAPLGWRLWSKGRVSLKTSKIKDRKQLSSIIRRVLSMRRTVHKPAVA
ncbi:MAG: 4Fe-4S dicluster domain-containing protein [Bacteroidota bacterium]